MDLWSLLADFIKTWVIDLIPRPLIVRTTHGGVRFVKGKKVKKIDPGFYFYWPFITEVVIYPTARQTAKLSEQCFQDKDGNPIVVRPILVYEVPDVAKALTTIPEIDEAVEDMSLATIKNFVMGKSAKEISDMYKSIDSELTVTCRRKLAPFGIKIVNVFLSDCTPAKVIKHYGIELSSLTTEEPE
jgi:regulator of protease activity HflC (stomatin/prohibitin superfamily)